MNNDDIPLNELTQEQYFKIMKKVRLADNQRKFMKTYSKTKKGKFAKAKAQRRYRKKKKSIIIIQSWWRNPSGW